MSVSSNIETELKRIILPPKLKKRGRPKGLTQTVVGLPRKRQCKNKIVAFLKKPLKERQHMMLDWFVGPDTENSAITETVLLIEDVIETNPILISSARMTKSVDINSIRQFFDDDAWECLFNTYERKLKLGIYTCCECKTSLVSDGQRIMCDSCLEWSHHSCVRLITAQKSKFRFCQTCSINI